MTSSDRGCLVGRLPCILMMGAWRSTTTSSKRHPADGPGQEELALRGRRRGRATRGHPLHGHRKLPPPRPRSLRLLARRPHPPARHDQPPGRPDHAGGLGQKRPATPADCVIDVVAYTYDIYDHNGCSAGRLHNCGPGGSLWSKVPSAGGRLAAGCQKPARGVENVGNVRSRRSRRHGEFLDQPGGVVAAGGRREVVVIKAAGTGYGQTIHLTCIAVAPSPPRVPNPTFCKLLQSQ